MRSFFAVACAFVMIAAPAIAAADDPGWTYAYENGVAAATQRDDHGRVTATLTCQPPTGDIIISDYVLGRDRALRRATRATVSINEMSVTIPAAIVRSGRDEVLTVHLPQRPPILIAVRQPTDTITVSVDNKSQTYLAGSAKQLKDLAYACWGS